ncbi:MAG: carboxylating nicotinate-nucleotide diphosphorylase [Acidobacteria bacterium]|nr:carboxylating nicotinate-nucleotide diphosphorylase [Acidobacteriota bacterium]
MRAVSVAPLGLEHYQDLVRRALDEDLGRGDLTTEATVLADQRATGSFIGKSACVVAGLEVAREVFRQLDASVEFDVRIDDGAWCAPGRTIAEVRGPARALLSAERTALNFLQRLCGIASLSRRFVEAAAGRITILDTRKTTPTLRALEKYAVRVGGARNHRMRLDDGILIKDNHARLAGGIAGAMARFRDAAAEAGRLHPEALKAPDLVVEVEAQSLDEVDEALAAGARRVLVDNMSPADVLEAVRRSRGRAEVEISGGVTLQRLPELAATGAEYVSVGALTHSAPAADISFEIEPN